MTHYSNLFGDRTKANYLKHSKISDNVVRIRQVMAGIDDDMKMLIDSHHVLYQLASGSASDMFNSQITSTL